MDASWVSEEDASGRERPAGDGQGRITLDAEGLGWRAPEGTVRVPWGAVFGAFVLDREEDEAELFVLVPRRPPMPPWLRVGPEGVPPGFAPGDLRGLAAAIESRMGHRGYRDPAGHRRRLSPRELLAEVLAHREVPGALEVPVGPGPDASRSRLGRVGRGMAAGAALGAILTATLVSVPAMGPLLLVAAAGGAVAGGFFTSGRARLLPRLGAGAKRVLVLAPDGAVVGLPSGVRVLAWAELGRFATETYATPGMGGETRTRACLTVGDAEGAILGRIDEAWFDAPLPLIEEVAEAYRTRVAPDGLR